MPMLGELLPPGFTGGHPANVVEDELDNGFERDPTCRQMEAAKSTEPRVLGPDMRVWVSLTMRLTRAVERMPMPAVGRAESFESVAFSPDDKYLACGSFSIAPRTLLVRWDASLEAWREHACELAGRDLTAEEWNRYVGSQRRDRVRVCSDMRQ